MSLRATDGSVAIYPANNKDFIRKGIDSHVVAKATPQNDMCQTEKVKSQLAFLA